MIYENAIFQFNAKSPLILRDNNFLAVERGRVAGDVLLLFQF